MKKYLLIFVCLNAWAGYCFSQTTAVTRQIETDSTKMTKLENAAIANPLFRQAFISTEYIGNANTTADLFGGNPLYKAKVSIVREKGNFNIPLLEWGKNNLSGSVSYLNQHYNVSQVQDYNPQIPIRDMNFYAQTIGFSLSYAHYDSLFNQPVIYAATVTGYTNQLSSVQKVSYLGALVFPIKSDNNVFKIGVVVIIDPSTFFPVLPYFSYWHKFNNNTELLIDLPRSIALRRQLTTDSWLALSIEQTSTFSFFSLNEPPLPQDAQYTQVEVKTGPSYEYRVAKKVILGVYGGVFSDIDARLTKRNVDWSNYYIRNHTGAAPYLNFTVSFLPFTKPLNKY